MIGPTTKDLAFAAGVSLATVDRVLNDRPNVSAKTKSKVNAAIERIGFERNLAAVNLVRKRPYSFRFLLPLSGDQFLKQIVGEVEKANKSLRTEMSVVSVAQLDMNDPHMVANYLSQISDEPLDGIAIMAPESPQVRDALARLHQAGMHIVQFLSGQEKLDELDFVGVNNFAAGATAGRMVGKFLRKTKGSIMIISETMQSLDSIERRHGFDDIININYPELIPLPSLETYGNKKRARKIISRQMEYNDDIAAIYVMNSEAKLPIEILSEISELKSFVIVVHERTPFSEKALRSENIDAIIAQNPGHAVRSALRILRARSEARQPVADQENLRIEILLAENL